MCINRSISFLISTLASVFVNVPNDYKPSFRGLAPEHSDWLSFPQSHLRVFRVVMRAFPRMRCECAHMRTFSRMGCECAHMRACDANARTCAHFPACDAMLCDANARMRCDANARIKGELMRVRYCKTVFLIETAPWASLIVCVLKWHVMSQYFDCISGESSVVAFCLLAAKVAFTQWPVGHLITPQSYTETTNDHINNQYPHKQTLYIHITILNWLWIPTLK